MRKAKFIYDADQMGFTSKVKKARMPLSLNKHLELAFPSSIKVENNNLLALVLMIMKGILDFTYH